jgi:hypothetical protein
MPCPLEGGEGGCSSTSDFVTPNPKTGAWCGSLSFTLFLSACENMGTGVAQTSVCGLEAGILGRIRRLKSAPRNPAICSQALRGCEQIEDTELRGCHPQAAVCLRVLFRADCASSSPHPQANCRLRVAPRSLEPIENVGVRSLASIHKR